MFYYLLITISNFIFLFLPNIKNTLFVTAIFTIMASAFLFSTYLLSIQLLKLREWCSWCLTSAFSTTLILLLALQNKLILRTLPVVIANYKTTLITLYALAILLGLILELIFETLLISDLKDNIISETEYSLLSTIRQIIWFSIEIVVICLYVLFMTGQILPKFSFKILILTGLVLINLVYDIFFSSKLLDIYSGRTTKQHATNLITKRSPFVLGLLSLLSWILLILTETTPYIGVSFIQFTFFYTIIILITGLFGLIVGRLVIRN